MKIQWRCKLPLYLDYVCIEKTNAMSIEIEEGKNVFNNKMFAMNE
jgi:hypothetical protein